MTGKILHFKVQLKGIVITGILMRVIINFGFIQLIMAGAVVILQLSI